uniref:Uncharacterized protein n=1 Tax=viral metagenome TaxID=1070528 RepID=A0A6C0M118_9ZZZZ
MNSYIKTNCINCKFYNNQMSICYKLSTIHKQAVKLKENEHLIKECKKEKYYEPSIKTMMGYKN